MTNNSIVVSNNISTEGMSKKIHAILTMSCNINQIYMTFHINNSSHVISWIPQINGHLIISPYFAP